MTENSRRDALKTALFIPMVAAAVSTQAQSAEQSKTASSGPGNKNSSAHERTKKPDAKLTPQKGRGTRMKFKEDHPSPHALPAVSEDEVKKLQSSLEDAQRSHKALTSTLPAYRIGSHFAYNSSLEDFSYIRCDLLANEASSLIASCMELRREWESVYEGSYAFLTDIDRFNRLDEVFKIEEANGFYDLEPTASQAELQAVTSAIAPVSNAVNAIRAIFNDLNTTFEDQYGWIQLLGWLSHISGYGQSGAATATVIWNGNPDTVIEYCYKAAVSQGLTQLQSQSNQLYSTIQSLQAQFNSLNARLSGLQNRATWDVKNIQFRKMRIQIIRDLYAQKQQLANEPSGALNFTERLAHIQSKFDATFSDALARFNAIYQGFVALFGFDSAIPPEVLAAINNPGNPQPSSGLLDLAASWLDEIGRWYSRFIQHEKTYSLCLSVRNAVSHDAWHGLLSSGNVVVNVPADLFPEQYYVRCRAVGMYTVGIHGFFGARVHVPSKSYYIHRDLTVHAVDQSAVPLQRLSRIMPADSSRATERTGMNTVFNCSPFGEWGISLTERSSIDEKREHLKDILLEVVVSEQ